jgi:cellulose synthase/poly-beta-1,6-N-acetylglucosamine synthase-like glycosyltransferase
MTTTSPTLPDARPSNLPDRPRPRTGWRRPAAVLAALWLVLFAWTAQGGDARTALGAWTVPLAAALHLPYVVILLFLALGLVERLGYLFHGRRPSAPGRLPGNTPLVCVQLPMFNEDAVAARVIEAAARMRWPAGRLEIQVLDDSTDPAIRAHVRATCARVWNDTGVPVRWIHRSDRTGYKAGALEAGRRMTAARFIAILDADFVPPPDFLERSIPHFYTSDGTLQDHLALVQAQWGHLNDAASPLTGAQAMWVDDHHTLQMAWRSATLGFVNFTGTAGIWRADAIRDAGGWRSASLVEDCELSMRALFAGWRTTFVGQIVVPAELPESVAAYRLQQKRWTQGWVQLQRLHLRTLATRYPTGIGRRMMLLYLMCIGWQWPLWAIWVGVLPFLIAQGLWLGAFGMGAALTVYLAPALGFAVFAATLSTVQARATYAGRDGVLPRLRRFLRVGPYLVVNAGMLAHHVCAFLEGLFGPMHAEFERTPKTAAVTGLVPEAPAPVQPPSPAPRRRPRLGYALAEVGMVATQAAWAALFLAQGQTVAAAGALWLVLCVALLRAGPPLKRALGGRAKPLPMPA